MIVCFPFSSALLTTMMKPKRCTLPVQTACPSTLWTKGSRASLFSGVFCSGKDRERHFAEP